MLSTGAYVLSLSPPKTMQVKKVVLWHSVELRYQVSEILAFWDWQGSTDMGAHMNNVARPLKNFILNERKQ